MIFGSRIEPTLAPSQGSKETEIVDDLVRAHLVDIAKLPGALNADAVEQLLAWVRSYLK